LVTGGDSGIGRAVAVAFAKEGADVAIAYLDEHEDAIHTQRLIGDAGRRGLRLPGDLAEPDRCHSVVERTASSLGGLDILVNNVAFQHPVDDFAEISNEQWRRTFAVNIDSYFCVTKAAVPHLPDGGAIVNTSSINGLRGNKKLIDYPASKGAVLALTYSLAQGLSDRGIRVNCVAPGRVWTPLIPATMDAETPENFGQHVPSAARRSRTKSRRHTCSSRPHNCRRITAVRCLRPSVAKRCRARTRRGDTPVIVIFLAASEDSENGPRIDVTSVTQPRYYRRYWACWGVGPTPDV
jgi:NAD(P)-dependent dehydrogenase (short-subunit alcohol dehydrogenase family)